MDPFESLLTQSSGKRVGAELLETLGRQASQMFLTQGIPLNNAIVQLAAQHPDLGNEHLKRIVEFANTVTFQSQFQDGENKVVDFDIADPGVILRDLKDGGSPGHDGKPLDQNMKDYAGSPGAGGQEQDPGVEAAFNDMFGQSAPSQGDGQMKMASSRTEGAYYGHTNPLDDVFDAHVRVRDTRDSLLQAHEHFDLLTKEAQELFYQAVKQEVINSSGAGLGGIIGGLEKLAEDDLVYTVMTPVIERLSREGVRDLHTSLEKTAGVFLNPQHNVVQTWAGLMKCAQEQLRARTALDDAEGAVLKTTDYLKVAGQATTGIRNAMSPGHGKVLPALRQRAVKGA